MRPDGSKSLTATFVALLGPEFVSVMGKIAFVPMPEPELVTTFVKLKSALETIVVASLALSFDVFAWPPPETDTELVMLDAAFCATLTVRLMAG